MSITMLMRTGKAVPVNITHTENTTTNTGTVRPAPVGITTMRRMSTAMRKNVNAATRTATITAMGSIITMNMKRDVAAATIMHITMSTAAAVMRTAAVVDTITAMRERRSGFCRRRSFCLPQAW